MSEVGRCYRLTVTRAAELEEIVEGGRTFMQAFENVLEIANLPPRVGQRIEFRIEKHRKKEPNRAELVLYNLNEESRSDLVRQAAMKIRIEAGYDNTTRFLFLGDLRFSSNVKTGTEWETRLQLADGGRAYSSARVKPKTYAPGTPAIVIIGDVAKALGVNLPPEVAASAELRSRIAAAEVTDGNAGDELTRILAQYGFEWSLQNEKLQVLRFDQAASGTVTLLSTPAEGGGIIEAPVIDPPKIVAPTKTGKSTRRKVPRLTVKHLLYPELTPGQRVEVRSRSINGTFRLDTVVHEGDSWGGDWITTVQATEL